MEPLQYHIERDGVSNHRRFNCLLNRLFRRRSKNTSKLRVTGLCAGNSPVTGEFPAEMASNAENCSIWWRQHGLKLFCFDVILLIFQWQMASMSIHNLEENENKGFPLDWFTEEAQEIIDQRGLVCFLCHLVLREAVQTVSCGTRFCEICYRGLFTWVDFMRRIHGLIVYGTTLYGSGHETVTVLLPGFAINW